MRLEKGRCWLLGDDINTDVLAPGKYIKTPIETLAQHCLESIMPTFAAAVRDGDVIVAGRNFGIGSSREQAAQALLQLGIKGVVAKSFGGIFYRNAINLGLPVLQPLSESDVERVCDGDCLQLDLSASELLNTTNNTVVKLQPLPDFLLHMVQSGGLVNVLDKRFGVEGS